MHAETTSQHILERAGCPIHYWLTGPPDAPLIVFTHGATIDHRSFDPQVPVVAAHYRMLTWDVRGHGLSRPVGAGFSIRQVIDDLLALLDHLEYTQATFVGLSMGGNISQEMAFLHPERVRALVAMDCACNTLKRSAFERWQAVHLAPAIMCLYPYELLKRQSVNASSLKPGVRAYLYQACSLLSKEEFITVFRELSVCLHYEPGLKILQPELLMHGDHDILGSIKRDMPLWAARDQESRFVVVPNASHCSNQDNPEFVNQQLLAFLQEHAG